MLEVINKPQLLEGRDVVMGTVIALIMATVFVVVGGKPLIATFIPSLCVGWITFLFMYVKKRPLPRGTVFIPLFMLGIAWQFLHFDEEFLNGFATYFTTLYGVAPYSYGKFVSINMVSYALFTLACLLVFTRQLRFLLIPVLFFIFGGALGNAIWHTWWVFWLKGYFPGFYTAQLYWLIGFVLLSNMVGSKKVALAFIVLLAAILVPALTFLSTPQTVESTQLLMSP